MAYLPCQNPSCRSHGKPHPNCRCWPGMAKGGETGHFCAEDRMHQEGCQYFQDGGQVVPADQVGQIQWGQPAPTPATEVPTDQVGQIKWDQPASAEVPADQVSSIQWDSSQPQTSQLGAGLEGAAQGIAGPLAPFLENKVSTALGIPELSYEAQAARKAEFPGTHYAAEAGAFAASAMVGVGEARLAASLGAKAAEIASLGKVGSAVVRNMAESGILATGNKVSDYLQNPDSFKFPEAAKDVGATMLVGGILGPVMDAGGHVLSKGKQALTDIANKDLARDVHLFSTGLGMAAKDSDPSNWTQFLPANERKVVNLGYAAYDTINKKMADAAVSGAEAFLVAGGHLPGYLILRNALESRVKGLVTKANEKFTMPVLIRAIGSGDGANAANAVRFGAQVGKGALSIADGVAKVFKGGATPAVDYAVTEADRERLSKSIEDNDLQSQLRSQAQPLAYAEGGSIPEPQPPLTAGSEGITQYYPDQAAQLGLAKGQILQYLNQLRPLPAHRLAYDEEPKDEHHDRQYQKTLDMAIQPLTILNKVKDGSLTAGELGHFKNLYPELHEHLSKKLTEQIVSQQMEDVKPSYRTQQGLGVFLGTAVNSVQTQSHLAAAQAVFAQKNAAMAAQNPPKPKRKTSTLSKASEQYQTGSQAAAARSKAS